MTRRAHPVRAAVLAAAVVACALAAGCDDASSDAAARGGDAEALRLLSLAPNLTEILFAMGLGSRIVGRSTYCTYPPEAASIPAVGDTMHLDLERIIRAEPTHAFLVTRRRETVRRLEGLGIRVVPLDADRMAQLREAIRTIGAETGRPDAAAALLDRIDSDLAAVRRRVAGLPRPRTLFAFPMTVGSSRIMVAGRGTFVDDLLRAAGAENAYPERADWPTVSPPQVVAMRPEVVIINAATEGPADRRDAIRRAWDELASVPAVRDGRVHILEAKHLTIPGPRVGQAARLLAETIHPELDAAPPVEPAAEAAGHPHPRGHMPRQRRLTRRSRGGLEKHGAPRAAGAETRRTARCPVLGTALRAWRAGLPATLHRETSP
ncbi:MAG: helical backbone metal receptor [Phycisphaerae bacterium]